MANHRADHGLDRSPSVAATPQVGKRARRDVEAPRTDPTTYVGKRVARPATPEPATDLPQASAAGSVPADAHVIPQVVPRVVPAVIPAPQRELRAQTLTVEPSAPAEALPIPVQAPLESAVRADTPGETTAEFDAIIAREAVRAEQFDSATDFSAEQTATMQIVDAPLVSPPTTVTPGKRRAARRAATAKAPLFRRVPSVPVLVGVAALAVSAGGAVTTATPDPVSAPTHTIRAATALGGVSSVGTVGTVDREATVSRNSGRETLADEAESAADAHVAALAKLAEQAGSYNEELKANRWELPLAPGTYRLTARYGDYGLWANYHTGLDFAGPYGSTIYAVAGGVVTSTGYDGAYGNKTVVTLENGTEIWYCHQSDVDVSVGDEVRSGDPIGNLGSTGNVTGPHLHLEVRPGGGDPVDPYSAMANQNVAP